MKILKYLALGVFGLIVLSLLIGLMMPKTWSVERSLVVKGDPATIHPIVGNLESWPRWMPWMEDDPQMQITFEGEAGKAGSKMSWKSEAMGNGTMTATASDPATGLRYELMMDEFTEPAHGSILYAKEGAGTRLTWKDEGTLGSNPLIRLLGPMLEGQLGHYFEKGLSNVKSLVEAGG